MDKRGNLLHLATFTKNVFTYLGFFLNMDQNWIRCFISKAVFCYINKLFSKTNIERFAQLLINYIFFAENWSILTA